MRVLIGIALGLLLLLAVDSYLLGGKLFFTITIFIDNLKMLWGL
jgi:hypothetical protein